MISPRTKPCRKECPTPKKLEGYRSGRGGNITHTSITSYGYGTLRLKKGPNLPGPIFPTLHIFRTFFIESLLPLGSHLHTPLIFYVRDPLSRLTFATPFRDSHSGPILRLTFATHICDPISRLPLATHIRDSFFATHIRDYTRDSHSRLAFATTLATLVHDSRSCSQLRLAIFCRDFRRATPPLTDGLF